MAMSFSMVVPGSILTSFSFLRILCSMTALYIQRFILHLETDAAITYTYSLDSKEYTVDISNELLDDRIAGMIAKVKQLDSMCSMQGSGLSKTVTTE